MNSIANLDKNYILEQIHRTILDAGTDRCSYQEGLEVMDTISAIQGQSR